VRKTFQLSDGTAIPAGIFISTPSYHICRDPAFYEAPLEFRPFRFAELREKNPSHAGDYMLTSIRSNHLAFGWGNLACPGRQFAACEMKLILALILQKYEFRLPDSQTERPENICVDARIWPSKTQPVEFRRRGQ
jgi:ent-kaurene oxidase